MLMLSNKLFFVIYYDDIIQLWGKFYNAHLNSNLSNFHFKLAFLMYCIYQYVQDFGWYWNLKRLIIDSKTFVIQRSGCYKNSFISYKLFCDDIYNCKYKGRKNFPSKANIIILYLFHVASRGLFAYNCEFRLILC